MKKYPPNNIWHEKMLKNDTKTAETWYKLVPTQSSLPPSTAGKYAFCSPIARCPNEKRILELEEQVSQLKENEISTKFDNILADCISTAYDQVLHLVVQAHDLKVFSWGSLIEMAKANNIINTYIEEAYISLGFTCVEWEELAKLKGGRNKSMHPDFTASMAYDIIQNCFADQAPAALRTGLTKAVGCYERRYE